MLKLSLFEFIIRVIPEVLIFMFSIYAFSQTKIQSRKYLVSSLIACVGVFIIRMLPINYGVHTILNIIMLTILACSINGIDKIKAIKSSIIMTITLVICEGINVAILSLRYGSELEKILENTKLKTIFGLPSLIVFGIITIWYYIYSNKRNKLSNV